MTTILLYLHKRIVMSRLLQCVYDSRSFPIPLLPLVGLTPNLLIFLPFLDIQYQSQPKNSKDNIIVLDSYLMYLRVEPASTALFIICPFPVYSCTSATSHATSIAPAKQGKRSDIRKA